MSELTLKQSIKDAHQVWTEIANTGLGKGDAVKSLVWDKKQSHLGYLSDSNTYCSFCTYDIRNRTTEEEDHCTHCPAAGMWNAANNVASCMHARSVYDSRVMSMGSPDEKKVVGGNMLEVIKKAAKRHNVKLGENHE